MDTYHDDILAFYRELAQTNEEKIEDLMNTNSAIIPNNCLNCMHRTNRRCDIAKKVCYDAWSTCLDVGWYESGAMEIPSLENAWRDGQGNRHTKSTGEYAEEMDEK